MQSIGMISSGWHFFPIQLAIRVGERRAIILSNIHYWIEKNKANGNNFKEGRYWTYNSAKAFKEIFPYLSERQIEYSLKELEKDNFLIIGNFNKAKYDRTNWYSLGDNAIPFFYVSNSAYTAISQNCDMDGTNLSNGIHNSVTPIPDINTDKIPDTKHYGISDSETQKIEEIWNSIIGTPNIRPLKKGSSRMKALNARFKDYGFEGLLEMLCKVRDSHFLTGNNPKNWTANFDWVLNPNNFLKIIEDTYINKEVNHERSNSNNQATPKLSKFQERAIALSESVDQNRHILDELPDDYRF